jgi:hypothetical protein
VQQHFLDLAHGCAVAQRAPHMGLELVGTALADQHRDRHQAPGAQVQAVALPGFAPGAARDRLLDRLGEFARAGQRLVDILLAQGLPPQRQALVVLGFHRFSCRKDAASIRPPPVIP